MTVKTTRRVHIVVTDGTDGDVADFYERVGG